jgi:hypothetical protein
MKDEIAHQCAALNEISNCFFILVNLYRIEFIIPYETSQLFSFNLAPAPFFNAF